MFSFISTSTQCIYSDNCKNIAYAFNICKEHLIYSNGRDFILKNMVVKDDMIDKLKEYKTRYKTLIDDQFEYISSLDKMEQPFEFKILKPSDTEKYIKLANMLRKNDNMITNHKYIYLKGTNVISDYQLSKICKIHVGFIKLLRQFYKKYGTFEKINEVMSNIITHVMSNYNIYYENNIYISFNLLYSFRQKYVRNLSLHMPYNIHNFTLYGEVYNKNTNMYIPFVIEEQNTTTDIKEAYCYLQKFHYYVINRKTFNNSPNPVITFINTCVNSNKIISSY